jgi:replicative DNA helicase
MFKLIQADMELDRQSRDLAAQYQKASAEERGKLKGLVEQAVNKHFEVRQERRALELKRLEEELKRLHEAIERRAKARKEIVAKRLAELLGQADDMHF